MTTIKAKYQNGNCLVSILSDGTKIRRYEGNPTPEMPESIDLKITNRCTFNCSYCSESSRRWGAHAEIYNIENILKQLQPGCEVAIGGGDPLSHPDIIHIARQCNAMRLIPNITIHPGSVPSEEASIQEICHAYNALELFTAIGVSYHSENEDVIAKLCKAHKHSVIHMILGIHTVEEIKKQINMGRKVLILGLKWKGRITSDGYKTELSIAMRYQTEATKCAINELLAANKNVISFDNLAIQQLELNKQPWFNKYFMGDDGQFSMFIDAIDMEYSKSSIEKRITLKGTCVQDAFRNCQNPNAWTKEE